MYENSYFSKSSPTLVILRGFKFLMAILPSVSVVLIFISLVINDVECLFMFLLAIYLYIFFGERSIQKHWLFLTGLLDFYFWFMRGFCVF